MMRAHNYYYKKAKRSKLEEDWVQYRSLWNLVLKENFLEDVSEKATKNPRHGSS